MQFRPLIALPTIQPLLRCSIVSVLAFGTSKYTRSHAPARFPERLPTRYSSVFERLRRCAIDLGFMVDLEKQRLLNITYSRAHNHTIKQSLHNLWLILLRSCGYCFVCGAPIIAVPRKTFPRLQYRTGIASRPFPMSDDWRRCACIKAHARYKP
jgi:hypothetical protein